MSRSRKLIDCSVVSNLCYSSPSHLFRFFISVTFAATAIYGYWWIVPICLWGLLWLRSNKSDFTFVDLLCIYGYSLTIYVPISFLWLIPLLWLQWLLVMLGMAMSGSVLLLTLWPAVKTDNKRVSSMEGTFEQMKSLW